MEFLAEILIEVIVNVVASYVFSAVGVILYLVFAIPFLFIVRLSAKVHGKFSERKPSFLAELKEMLNEDQIKVITALRWIMVLPLAWSAKQFFLIARDHLPQFGVILENGLPAYRLYLDPAVGFFVALSVVAFLVPSHKRISVAVGAFLLVGTGGLLEEFGRVQQANLPGHVYGWILAFCTLGFLKAFAIAHYLDKKQATQLSPSNQS